MTMTQNPTRTIESTVTPLEALFPREQYGIRMGNGQEKPIFLGHPDARCDICEGRFGSERLHPKVENRDGLVEICGGHYMRLTTAKS